MKTLVSIVSMIAFMYTHNIITSQVNDPFEESSAEISKISHPKKNDLKDIQDEFPQKTSTMHHDPLNLEEPTAPLGRTLSKRTIGGILSTSAHFTK